MNLQNSEMLGNLSHLIASGLNDWGSLHPVIVHFPIALLFMCPLFILCGLFSTKRAKSFFLSAAILMILGTGCIFLATSSGDAAAELLDPDPSYVMALDSHVKTGESARLYFSILTVIFMLYIIFSSFLAKKFNSKTIKAAISLFLIIYCAALLILFNAAHYGGVLVHKHGIKSTLYSK